MLIDEILAVGDESFQRKCMARIAERMAAGTTLVLVSHDPSAIERICRRVVVLDDGKVAFDGDTADGLLFYHRLLGTGEGRSRSLRPDAAERAQLEIAELELVDAGGRPRAAFRTGEELGVRMTRARAGARRARGGGAGGARPARRGVLPHRRDGRRAGRRDGGVVRGPAAEPAGRRLRRGGRRLRPGRAGQRASWTAWPASRWRTPPTARAWPTCAARGRWWAGGRRSGEHAGGGGGAGAPRRPSGGGRPAATRAWAARARWTSRSCTARRRGSCWPSGP